MARVKIRYLVTKPGRGGARHFWQPSRELRAAGWRAVRLDDDRDRAIAEAERLNARLDAWRRGEPSAGAKAGLPAGALAKAGRGTMEALICAYRGSRHYRRLRPTTKRGYEQCLGIIAGWCGDAPVRSLDSRTVQRFYEWLQVSERKDRKTGKTIRVATPAKANATIRVLRLLLEYGCREEWIAENPAARPALEGGARKGRLWSRAAVDAFVAAADDAGRHSIGTAVRLNEWLGQREGDVLTLSRAAYRDGALHVEQQKTGARVALPVDLVPELKQRLDAERARQDAARVTATTLIVSETTGRPYRAENFRALFAEVRAAAIAKARADGDEDLAAELEGLWFMHLRHTAVTRLAEAEVDLPGICAITGHALATAAQIVDRYLVRTAALARAAFARRLEKEKQT